MREYLAQRILGFKSGQSFLKMATNSSSVPVVLDDSAVPGAKLREDPEKCLVEELQRWLGCHGLKKTGKKDDLITRVRDSLCLNLPVDPKIDGGKWYNLKAQSTRDVVSLNHLPNRVLPSTGWKTFPSRSLPANFNYGHVYFYLIESVDNLFVGFHSDDEDAAGNDTTDDTITDTITAKALRKGRNLLGSGFVEDIQDNFIENSNE
jgi:hypothetical protein